MRGYINKYQIKYDLSGRNALFECYEHKTSTTSAWYKKSYSMFFLYPIKSDLSYELIPVNWVTRLFSNKKLLLNRFKLKSNRKDLIDFTCNYNSLSFLNRYDFKMRIKRSKDKNDNYSALVIESKAHINEHDILVNILNFFRAFPASTWS